MDVKSMSISQLKELDIQLKAQRDEVASLIAILTKRERRAAIDQIYGIAHKLGLPLHDLLPDERVLKRKPGAIYSKYVDPTNPANVWLGVGPRPKWLKDALAAGVQIDQLKAA